MKCSKCSGKVVVERAFTTATKVELSCLRCGKYWVLNLGYGPNCASVVMNEGLHELRG